MCDLDCLAVWTLRALKMTLVCTGGGEPPVALVCMGLVCTGGDEPLLLLLSSPTPPPG